jgi:UDP-glucose 4-epimerase
MSKVLITGGCGYVGSHVNKLLSEKGYQTVVVDNLVHGHKEFAKWGKFVEMDLCDRAGLDKLFAEQKFDAVLHFAGYIAVGESVKDPASYYRNNVIASLNLLEAMRLGKVGAIIFSSTAAVYGEPVQIPLTEDHPLNPINPYGRNKLFIEQALADFSEAYGLRWTALRYFNAAGACPDSGIGEWHQPETHLIPLVLDAALGLRPSVLVYGFDYDTPDGTCIRDYIHVDDLAQAHLLALEYLDRGGDSDCFNLGNGKGFSVSEVIETAREVTGREIKVEMVGRREGDPPRLIASSEKAKRVLKWGPKYQDLKNIIETAWDWHRDMNAGMGRQK